MLLTAMGDIMAHSFISVPKTERDQGRSMAKDLVAISRFMSLVLRHRPSLIGVELDNEGWVPILDFLDGASRIGKVISLKDLKQVVASDDKQRYALSDDGLSIRANQGHSARGVNLSLQPRVPPDRLYHGTVARFLDSIRKQGLLKRTRHHVHLSADVETAKKVGSRRGQPVVLRIAAAEMHHSGLTFFLSENGVWLTDSVPVAFIAFDDVAPDIA